MDESKLSAIRTGQAYAAPGGIAVSGIVTGTLRLPARSAYRYQVEQIFQWELVGRQEELAELARFCTSHDGPAYVWWQGPAWAGKSALMAWFVLHPPPGVRLVSFFVTARYHSQSDGNAFQHVVLEQLAEVAGQPMPDLLTESTRQAHLARLLAEAGQACAGAGERLVLVVDGLDEDRGVTAGPHAHSIAALLPERPPEGMRVIVAGRPDPPVPADVPRRHPLRDPAIVRRVSVSPHAQIIRADAERELEALLDSGGPEHHLLGLVASAGGGLSSADLAELTELPERVVVRHLRAVSGRTFRSRGSPEAKVYVLAHEELHEAAIESLGEAEVAAYRERLHAWADAYRRHGWPGGTPDYLLRGYAGLLYALRDASRLVDCATDPARLERLFDVAGGDAAAFTELGLAQELIGEQESPDLAAMLDVVAARASLMRRSENIPAGLPAAWARLGNPDRAESLYHSLVDSRLSKSLVDGSPNRNSLLEASADLVEVLVGEGDLERADTLVRPAPHAPLETLTGLTGAWLGRGRPDRAEKLARALATDVPGLLPALVEQLADAGDVDGAERLLETVDRGLRLNPLLALIRARAAAGEPERARLLARRAEKAADLDSGVPEHIVAVRAQTLTTLAKALVAAGEPDRARCLADEVERTALALPLASKVLLLIAVATVWAAVNEPDRAQQAMDRAEATAHAQTRVPIDVPLIVEHALAFVEAEEPERARPLVHEAERELGSSAQHYPGQYLAVVQGLAGLREWERAEALARSLDDPDDRDEGLFLLAAACAGAAEPELSARYAADVTDAARQEALRSQLVEALAEAGDMAAAEHVAWSLETAAARVLMVFWLAWVGAEFDPEGAREAADDAESAAEAVTEPYSRALVQAQRAQAWADLGERDRAAHAVGEAERLAATLTDPGERAEVLADLAETLVRTGDPVRGEEIAAAIEDDHLRAIAFARLVEIGGGRTPASADRSESAARSITGPDDRVEWLIRMAEIWTAAGDRGQGDDYAERAENAIDALPDVNAQAKALADLAAIRARLGQAEEARRVAERAEAVTATDEGLGFGWWPLSSAVRAWLAAGDPDRAQAVTAAMTDSIAWTSVQPDGIRWADPRTLLITELLALGLLDRAEAVLPDPSTGLADRALIVELVRARLAAGDLDRAEDLLRWLAGKATGTGTIAEKALNGLAAGAYAMAVAEVARARTAAGDAEGARRLAEEVDAVVSSRHAAGDPSSPAVNGAVALWVAAGDPERGRRLARLVESSMEELDAEHRRAETLLRLTLALARADAFEQAEKVTRTLPGPLWLGKALLPIALRRAEQGDLAAARRLADEGEELIAGRRAHDDLSPVLTLAGTLAVMGEADRAWAVARSLAHPFERMEAAGEVTLRLTNRDDLQRARAHIDDLAGDFHQLILAVLAQAQAEAGDLTAAAALVDTLTDPYAKAMASCALALARQRAGQPKRARRLAAAAEALAPAIVEWADRGLVLRQAQAVWIAVGDLERAEAVATSVAEPFSRLCALVELAEAHVGAGDADGARRHARQAETLLGAVDGLRAPIAPGWVVRGWAVVGDLERAEAVAGSIDDGDHRAAALALIARHADPPYARRLIMMALACARDHRRMLSDVATTDLAALSLDRPDRLARWGLQPS
ncbi:hypothetical protein AB0L53_55000 [Nonomuraea sp. NPDC052129]|uniref:hypothetical protein n=1 Tax=Nonomuraea sp. NPDC052129 TaxID=3154651 RepID=UPI00341A7430